MELDIWVIRSVNFGWMDHSIKKKKKRMDGLVIKLCLWLVILYACFICSELFSMFSYFTRHFGDLAQFQGQWPFQFKGQSALEASLMYAVCKQLLIFSIFFSFSPIFRQPVMWTPIYVHGVSQNLHPFAHWARTCNPFHQPNSFSIALPNIGGNLGKQEGAHELMRFFHLFLVYFDVLLVLDTFCWILHLSCFDFIRL